MKGKLFGIWLILCFIAPVATTFAILQFQKKQVKREFKWKMIAGIDKAELVLLKFTDQEKQTLLNWEHPKEFEYQGEMYDIVETAQIGDTTYYWTWWDNEETKLNIQLDELVSFALGNNPKNQENRKRLQNFLKSLYYSNHEKTESLVFAEMKNKYPSGYVFYLSVFNAPPVPPPEKS